MHKLDGARPIRSIGEDTVPRTLSMWSATAGRRPVGVSGQAARMGQVAALQRWTWLVRKWLIYQADIVLSRLNGQTLQRWARL